MTAIVPAAAAGCLLWFVPEACNAWVSASRHRWTCLLPGLLIVVPAAVAIVLTIATLLNQRRKRPISDGWLVTVVAVGLLTQALLVVAYLIATGPAYIGSVLAQAVFVPQPFIAGAFAGAIFWTALHWRRPVRPTAG